MSNNSYTDISHNHRVLYGKLFSALMKKFGTNHVHEIEDAIQNSFLKSLKTWHADKIPTNKEDWLFVVARNDVLNQIKKKNKVLDESPLTESRETDTVENDLRLETIMFLLAQKKISDQAKALFILKNIFGLSVREISESTLVSQEAIYKSLNRTKTTLRLECENRPVSTITQKTGNLEIACVEEILYAVFNVGFDSFNDKIESIVNEDLCLEAIALAKELFKKYSQDSTRSLLALFCFHIARIPAKIDKGRIVSFHNQSKTKWNKTLLSLGFSYLRKPEQLNRFYIEALIVSKHMTSNSMNAKHWKEIIKLYELLIPYSQSPIVKLNLCYALHQANRTEEALAIVQKIEKELPDGHFYYSLIKAEVVKKTSQKEWESIMAAAIEKIEQASRKTYLLENMLIKL